MVLDALAPAIQPVNALQDNAAEWFALASLDTIPQKHVDDANAANPVKLTNKTAAACAALDGVDEAVEKAERVRQQREFQYFLQNVEPNADSDEATDTTTLCWLSHKVMQDVCDKLKQFREACAERFFPWVEFVQGCVVGRLRLARRWRATASNIRAPWSKRSCRTTAPRVAAVAGRLGAPDPRPSTASWARPWTGWEKFVGSLLSCAAGWADATWRALRHDVTNAAGNLAVIGTLKTDGEEQEKKKLLKATHASILEKKLVVPQVPQVLWQRLEAALGL